MRIDLIRQRLQPALQILYAQLLYFQIFAALILEELEDIAQHGTDQSRGQELHDHQRIRHVHRVGQQAQYDIHPQSYGRENKVLHQPRRERRRLPPLHIIVEQQPHEEPVKHEASHEKQQVEHGALVMHERKRQFAPQPCRIGINHEDGTDQRQQQGLVLDGEHILIYDTHNLYSYYNSAYKNSQYLPT